MAVVDVINSSGKKVSQVDLNDEIFNVPVKSSVLHEVVTMQLANKRAGSGAHSRAEADGRRLGARTPCRFRTGACLVRSAL